MMYIYIIYVEILYRFIHLYLDPVLVQMRYERFGRSHSQVVAVGRTFQPAPLLQEPAYLVPLKSAWKRLTEPVDNSQR